MSQNDDSDNTNLPSNAGDPSSGDTVLAPRTPSRDTFGGMATNKGSSSGASSTEDGGGGPHGKPVGGGLSRSSTFGISTGADSLSYVHRDDDQGGGGQQGARRRGDVYDSDDSDADSDADNDDDALYGASSTRAAGRVHAVDGTYDSPGPGAGSGASAGSGRGDQDTSYGSTSGGGGGSKQQTSPQQQDDKQQPDNNRGHDSKLGKFLEKTGGALHSDRLVEKGRQKREDAALNDD